MPRDAAVGLVNWRAGHRAGHRAKNRHTRAFKTPASKATSLVNGHTYQARRLR